MDIHKRLSYLVDLISHIFEPIVRMFIVYYNANIKKSISVVLRKEKRLRYRGT